MQSEWASEQQQAFEETNRVISKETPIRFPDFAKPFHVYTEVSNYQLSAVNMQNNKPFACYSHKVTSSQTRYATGEQEVLSIAETLKEFRTLLYGQETLVHTHYKNIIFGKSPSDGYALEIPT